MFGRKKATTQATFEQLERQLADSQALLTELRGQATSSKGRVAELNELIAGLEERLASAEEAAKQKEKDLTETQRQLHELTKQHTQAVQEYRVLRHALPLLSSELHAHYFGLVTLADGAIIGTTAEARRMIGLTEESFDQLYLYEVLFHENGEKGVTLPLIGTENLVPYYVKTIRTKERDPPLEAYLESKGDVSYRPLDFSVRSIGEHGYAFIVPAAIRVRAVHQQKQDIVEISDWRMDPLNPQGFTLDILPFLALGTNKASSELVAMVQKVFQSSILIMELHGNVGDYEVRDRIMGYLMHLSPQTLVVDLSHATYVGNSLLLSTLDFGVKNAKVTYILPPSAACYQEAHEQLDRLQKVPEVREIRYADTLEEALATYGIKPGDEPKKRTHGGWRPWKKTE